MKGDEIMEATLGILFLFIYGLVCWIGGFAGGILFVLGLQKGYKKCKREEREE
jgi:hypothetical protein